MQERHPITFESDMNLTTTLHDQAQLEKDLTLGEGPMTRGRLKRLQEAIGTHVNAILAQGNRVQVKEANRAEVLLIQAQEKLRPIWSATNKEI